VIRWATFDCFGTLVDWRHGIATGIELLFPGRGAELLEVYHRFEPQVQAEVQAEVPVRRYREVLAESLRRTAAEAGLALGADDASVLGTGLPYWPVFPDARAALTALREAGWRLALLTNCDRDLIGETQRRLAVPIDAIVTAEDAGEYKPGLGPFRRFAASFEATAGNWVHVAQSHFHDMVPARALGIPRVWINRHADPHDPAVADAVRPGLDGLLPVLEQVHAAAR
jgi:2-haloacid dehalogenase